MKTTGQTEARALAARARKLAALSVEAAQDDCWNIYRERSAALRELADEMDALADQGRARVYGDRQESTSMSEV